MVSCDYHTYVGGFVVDTLLPDGPMLLEQGLDATDGGACKAPRPLDPTFAVDWVINRQLDKFAKPLGFDPGASDIIACDMFEAIATPGTIMALLKSINLASVNTLERGDTSGGRGGCGIFT
jgi:hypothetical protein